MFIADATSKYAVVQINDATYINSAINPKAASNVYNTGCASNNNINNSTDNINSNHFIPDVTTTPKITNKAELDNFAFAQQYINAKGVAITDTLIVIDAKRQVLELYKNNCLANVYTVSTSSRGLGEINGTKKTPLGLHKVTDKVGAHAPPFAIFKHRTFTGQIWPKNTPRHKHRKDYIVTRILHLEGLETGLNRGKRNGVSVDSKERGIYIHGTTMEWKLGKPSSIGCIHMSSSNVTKLFEQAPVGTLVLIKA